MEHKKQKRNQIIVAWLLLLALIPMNMVKGFHHHDERTSEHATEHESSHSHDNCQICQFVLSPFLEAEASELALTVTLVDCGATTYLEESYATAINSYYLRGPPELMS